MDEQIPLVVDEEFFIGAIRLLGELEAGDAAYSVTEACQQFVDNPYLASRFAVEAEREWTPDDRRFAEFFFGALYQPHDLNEHLDAYLEERDEMVPAGAHVIRTAIWSFMAAWTQRYGGLRQDLIERGVVDPDRATQ